MDLYGYLKENNMQRAVEWFLWGLFMGAGWACAIGLINLLLMILGSGHHVNVQ